MVKYGRQQVLSDIRQRASEEMTLQSFVERVDYSRDVVIDRFQTWTNAKVEAGIDVNAIECPNCGVSSEYVSNHWNKCGEPELSEKQKSLLTGALMSDGTVDENGSMTIYSSNRDFLGWLSRELSFMAYEPYLNDKGQDRHERNIKSGFDTDRDAEYRDVYALSVPSHSFTKSMREWYSSGDKKIPEDVSLDVNTLKVWYCGDGGLHWSGDRAYAEIRPISQEIDTIERILDGLCQISYSVQSDGTVCFYSDTDKFLEYISPAPGGMEYKWCNDDREYYDRLKP